MRRIVGERNKLWLCEGLRGHRLAPKCRVCWRSFERTHAPAVATASCAMAPVASLRAATEWEGGRSGAETTSSCNRAYRNNHWNLVRRDRLRPSQVRLSTLCELRRNAAFKFSVEVGVLPDLFLERSRLHSGKRKIAPTTRDNDF